MNRTQVQSTAKPNRNALAPAMASMTTGLSNRSATSAPSHNPTWDAAHAQPGVNSQPTTTRKCAIHLGTVALPFASQSNQRENDEREHEPGAGGDRHEQDTREPEAECKYNDFVHLVGWVEEEDAEDDS